MQAPEVDFDPFSRDWIAQRHERYEDLREAGPVVRLSLYGVYATGRWAEAKAVLADADTFISSAGVGIDDLRAADSWRPKGNVLEADAPEHDITRGILNTVLSARAMRAFREDFAAKARAVAEEVVAAGEIDAATALGATFPLSVFPDAMGIGKEGRENLLLYSDMIFNAFGPRNEIFEDTAAKAGPVVEWLLTQCSRKALTPDGWGAEIYALSDQAGLSEDEAGVIVRALLTAGLDTTVSAITSGVVAFARHPAEWDKVVADPKRASRIIDEIIRWQTPIQLFFRTTSRAVELGGVELPKDAKIMVAYGAANRDPRVWDDPNRFDLDRRVTDHLALGHGVHRCVGQMVARLEVELIFAALAERVARFELTAPPVLGVNNALRGFASASVRLVAR